MIQPIIPVGKPFKSNTRSRLRYIDGAWEITQQLLAAGQAAGKRSYERSLVLEKANKLRIAGEDAGKERNERSLVLDKPINAEQTNDSIGAAPTKETSTLFVDSSSQIWRASD